MKKSTTTPATVPAAAAPAAAPISTAPETPKPKKIRTPDPVLDHKTAKPVTPRRHEKSGRTIGHHQPVPADPAGGVAQVHLFSPTGNFIETVPAADVAKFEPQIVSPDAPKDGVIDRTIPPAPVEVTFDAPTAAPEAPAAS